MKDIVSEYQELFRRHRIQLRRYTAFLLALAMMTTLFVNWQLHSDGIAKTADYQCNLEEHEHTADCYQKVLVCGYEEGEPEDWTVAEPDGTLDAAFGVDADESSAVASYSAEPEYIFVPHEHTDDCYQEVKTLTCLEEEHVHDDDCFDPEDGSLICDLFEHTHDDSCYDTEYELVCGLEEGELVEELNPDYNPVALFEEPVAAKPVVVEPVVEAPVHHHTDACYEEELVCTLPEHHHTVNCLADPFADVEDEEEWLAKTDTTLDHIWTDDLLTVAKSQLGYEQSEKNFELDADDGQTLRHYTRYGQWYGNPYGAWDVMFLSYCLNYAGIPQSAIPQRAGVQALLSDLRGAEYMGSFEGDLPLEAVMPGDIVVYQTTASETVAVQDEPQVVDLSADADTELLDSLTTSDAPQTTTQTSTVDTVGIVSEVDEDAGTLTVISGNVDGKVAEVTLTASQVSTLVSVASAQAVVEDGVDTLQEVSLSESWISDTTLTIDGKTTIIKENGVNKNNSEISITDASTVELYYKFTTSDANYPVGTTLTYQLPAGLSVEGSSIKGTLLDENDQPIADVTVDAKGKLTITLTKEISGQFSGHFTFKSKIKKDSTNGTDQITFPGNSTVIRVTPQQDLKIEKKSEIKGMTSDGKYIVHYTVTLSTKKGSGGDVTLYDYILDSENDSNFGDAVYSNVKLDGKDLPHDGYNYAQTNTEHISSSKLNSSTYCRAHGIHITYNNESDLPELKENSSYVLEYDLTFAKLTDDAAKFYNLARANGNVDDKNETSFRKEMSKRGSYDKETGLILWTIEIHTNGVDLTGRVLSDTLPEGTKMTGRFYITTRWDGEYLYESDNFFTDQTSFTYKFGNADEKKEYAGQSDYYVYYYTTAPDGFKIGDTVKNHAELNIGGDRKDDAIVSYPDDRETTKTAMANTELTANQADSNGVFTLPWKVSYAAPLSWGKNNTLDISDTIKEPDIAGVGDHYAIANELYGKLTNSLVIIGTDGKSYSLDQLSGITLEMKFYKSHKTSGKTVASESSDPVGAFKLTFKKSDDYSGPDIDRIEFEYSTKATAEGLTAGQKVTFQNTCGEASAEYHYSIAETQHLSKTILDKKGSNYSDYKDSSENDPLEVAYGNAEDGSTIIYYQLELAIGGNKDNQLRWKAPATVVDTLPKGVTFLKDSIEIAFLEKGKLNSSTPATPERLTPQRWATPNENGWPSGSSTFDITPFVENKNFFTGFELSGQTVTFHLTRNFGGISITGDSYPMSVLIRYAVKVNDDAWDTSKTSETLKFDNSATWVEANSSDSAHATVTRESVLAEKHAAYNESTNIVSYKVIVNPDGLKIGDQDKFTITDVMHPDSDKRNTAQLVKSSVKLYSYDPSATDLKGAEIPSDAYFVDYVETPAGSDGKNYYTLKVSVPNGHAYVLEYQYKNISNRTYKMHNSVEIAGFKTGEIDTKVEEAQITGGLTQVGLTIHKVDSQNISVGLSGATFSLERYDPTKHDYVTVIKKLEPKDTDPSSFYLTFSDSGSTNGTKRAYNTLYRLKETDPPVGYKRNDDWAYYFIWKKAGEANADSYKAATGVGSTSPAEGAEVTFSDIHFHESGESVTLTVKNESKLLTVQKLWYDENNKAIAGNDSSLPPEITVELYKTKDMNLEGEKVKELTLNSANDWKATYEIPDEDINSKYHYYVKEVNSDRRYVVSYSNNDITSSGTILVTNTKIDASHYELPSTGGAGTTLYTAVGGTMMLAALVCGLCRKRRRERGVH